MQKFLFFWLGSLLLSGSLLASGFQVALQGQKQVGMAHTGTGLALDPAALFFNPGAMSHLRENGFTLGASGIISNIAFVRSGTTTTWNTDNPVSTPFAVYGVWGPKDSPFKFGIGAYTPYGSTVRWEENWIGRNLLEQLSLRAIAIQPTISYNLDDRFGFGIGLVYVIGGVNLQRQLPVTDQAGNPGEVELDGRANGLGFNAGFYFRPLEGLSLGATYRSRVAMQVDGGDANFDVPASARASFPAGNTFNATLPLAAVASIGVGYEVTDKLTLALDINYTFWETYDSLTFEYEQPLVVNGQPTSRTASPREYQNAFAYRLGAQYQASEALALRAGAYYDETPVRTGYMTAETPDADRVGLSVGAGYRVGKLAIDASLLFIQGMEREQTEQEVDEAGTASQVLPGRYQLQALIPGVSVSYHF
ncbi:long-chain fatty acid transport protein [Catalinimonas alkaloidigena]|uniref:Long-chain fatty acid transport protein n=1 Tax=Catalinimonas alkaloidigena TaxID=1075417 RepID=A0A1G9N7H7_9BACT|nr:outer membrane protein transport protein [Catalinimonas alkaloidigena]SDL82430.1 long-chain fatty acid transport protein [Catalinimonas alkaloidigena]